MTHTRTAGLLAALALGAFLMAGCGGGGGEPSVAASVHELLQQEYDAALLDLRAEREARQAAQTARNAAQAQVMRLTGDLDTATSRVSALTAQIGAATDAANASAAASLHAQLNAAKAQVTTLTARIGAATDTANPAATASLHAQLNAAKAQVTTLTAQIGAATDAANPAATASLHAQLKAAKAEVTRLTAALDTANTARLSLEGRLTTAEEEAETAQQQAAQARQDAQEAEQRTSDLDATQRAKNFRSALVTTTAAPSAATPTVVTVNLRTKNSVSLERGGYRATTGSVVPGTGLRSATLPLVSGNGKTVVYTDVELSRSLLEHYLPGDATATRLALNQTALGFPTLTDNEIGETNAEWEIAHGVPKSVNAVDGDPNDNDLTKDDLPTTAQNPRRATSYSGSLHGVPGRFVCTGTGCRVQVTPDYVDTVDDEKFLLEDVILASTTAQGVAIADGQVYFVPSAVPSLYTGTGNRLGGDGEYMVFGYWREDPVSPAGQYRFEVFARIVGTVVTTVPTATYDGIAVGGYAEKDPTAAVETWRQGEFTANVHLTADGTNLEGTIDDFVVNPTGGSTAPATADRWAITLNEASGGTGTLNLSQMPGTNATAGDGSWASAFVSSRQTTGGVPPAVTGTFEAEITNSLNLAGAFGAEKR